MDRRELLALSISPIFRNVDIVEIDKILSKHQPSIKNFTRNEVVWLQGEKLDRLIIVIDGILKAQMESPDGKIINMEEFSNSHPVAIPILFSQDQKLPVTLYSKVDSEVFFLPKNMLLECCMSNKTVLENTLALMSNKVDFLSKKIQFLQLKTIKQKIASTLIKLEPSHKGVFKVPTKEELAKEMGVTRPSLSREFASLVKEGIITQDRDKISIINMDKLKKWLS